MGRFIEGEQRSQVTLLPQCLDDFIAEDNPVRVVGAFVEELDLRGLGFDSAAPAQTGRPSYHPAVLLKIYIYGYLNRIQSSRRLEREAQRNFELMWLTGRLASDFSGGGSAARRVKGGQRPAQRTLDTARSADTLGVAGRRLFQRPAPEPVRRRGHTRVQLGCCCRSSETIHLRLRLATLHD